MMAPGISRRRRSCKGSRDSNLAFDFVNFGYEQSAGRIFREYAALSAGEFTKCAECGGDYHDEQLNSDLAVRKGAPLCDGCFAKLDKQPCAICQKEFSAAQLIQYADIKDGAPVCLPCFADVKRSQAGG